MSVGFSARHRQQTKASVPIRATGTFVPLTPGKPAQNTYVTVPPKDGGADTPVLEQRWESPGRW